MNRSAPLATNTESYETLARTRLTELVAFLGQVAGEVHYILACSCCETRNRLSPNLTWQGASFSSYPARHASGHAHRVSESAPFLVVSSNYSKTLRLPVSTMIFLR